MHAHERELLRELAQHVRQDARAHALVRAEAERRADAVGEPVEIVVGELDAADEGARVAVQELAGLGQIGRFAAARALDQLLADEPLERRHLVAHGRLRVAEPPCRARERALLRDGVERDEVPHRQRTHAIEFVHVPNRTRRGGAAATIGGRTRHCRV
jgi:hypothetical protein